MIEKLSSESGLKALTLTQPWASLMQRQEKVIETRSWYTSYRGELVIHSAKGFPKLEREMCRWEHFYEALGKVPADQLPLSCGLCVVQVLACIKTTELHKVEAVLGRKPNLNELRFGNYAPGRYAWVTRYVRRLDNIGPVKGSLGLWNWSLSRQECAEHAVASGEAHL